MVYLRGNPILLSMGIPRAIPVVAFAAIHLGERLDRGIVLSATTRSVD